MVIVFWEWLTSREGSQPQTFFLLSHTPITLSPYLSLLNHLSTYWGTLCDREHRRYLKYVGARRIFNLDFVILAQPAGEAKQSWNNWRSAWPWPPCRCTSYPLITPYYLPTPNIPTRKPPFTNDLVHTRDKPRGLIIPTCLSVAYIILT